MVGSERDSESVLLLRFAVHLGEQGVVFHRWLPTSEEHSIKFPTEHPKAEIKVWFRRDEFIRSSSFDDPTFTDADIPHIGAMASGPLRGALTLCHPCVSRDEISAVAAGQQGELYDKLARQIVGFLLPPVSRFIRILRVVFGQYWLRSLEPWDSRTQTLGNYCRNVLQLHWSTDGNEWSPFVPGPLGISLSSTIGATESFREYLIEEDWRQLAKVTASGFLPPPAADALCRAHEFADTDKLNEGFVQGVTALELAASELMKPRLEQCGQFGWFKGLTLRQKTAVAASLIDGVPEGVIKDGLEAIAVRNAIVHDGVNANGHDWVKLRMLLRMTALIIDKHARGPLTKLPHANIGNREMPSEKWDCQ
ncbi:MAG: hypothetical protein JW940_28845 [Polyangiaceae bacterium]|nr:hypothetical protein [Polyangiaceae bacterium]